MIEIKKIEIEYSSLPVSHIDFVWFLSGLDECYAREEIHRIVLNGIEKMKSPGINCSCSPEESKRREILDEPRCSRQAAADVLPCYLIEKSESFKTRSNNCQYACDVAQSLKDESWPCNQAKIECPLNHVALISQPCQLSSFRDKILLGALLHSSFFKWSLFYINLLNWM